MDESTKYQTLTLEMFVSCFQPTVNFFFYLHGDMTNNMQRAIENNPYSNVCTHGI